MKKAIAALISMIMTLGLGTSAYAVNAPLSMDQAMQAALHFVGVNASEAAFTTAHKGYDDGREVFEIEFYANNTEYDMDVDAYTGRITDFNSEYHGARTTGGNGVREDRFDLDHDRDGRFDRDRDWDGRFDWDHDWDDRYDWDESWDFD